MELGQRLKQARLEAGLSQRQLCADIITRNMLSQIENGSARPSMDTLRALSARLNKPMGYFLEDQAVTSPNLALMAQARAAEPKEALELLRRYDTPDPVFDGERWLLEALACLSMAATAMEEARPAYAAKLLEQAAAAGKHTPYYTPELERRRLLLCHRVGTADPVTLAALLPDHSDELLLRAEAALQSGDPDQCGRILDSMAAREPQWHALRAESYLAQKDYASAAAHYQSAEQTQRIYARLEQCYRELEDYKQAYYYACKQK